MYNHNTYIRVNAMTLPTELQNIFKHKQKSYKMVLVLALLEEMKELGQEKVLFSKVRERFLGALQERERNGQRVDASPSSVASNWSDITINQIHTIIDNPINALSSIIERDIEDQTIGFKPTLLSQWSEKVHVELQQYAERELAAYYQEPNRTWSLREELQHVMDGYLQAKTEQFKSHQLGNMVRRTIPNEISGFSFIHDQLKVQGSVGQGNWATVPWIAIMDNRVTTSTQRGEYIVYLFSEDMSSVYLTFNQGVTEPKNERGKPEAYKYLQHKVDEVRDSLPLTGMNKDDHIHLATGGLGYDYQVSTVAYYRYDRDQLPDDEQLMADLQNVVDNYKQYVEGQMNQEHIPHDETEHNQEDMEAPLVVADELQRIQTYIRQKGFSYPEHLIENFYLSLKTKPFVILAGVSGTGKTKLVKLFAEALGAIASNQQFTLIPVRPDWSDPSDLLGYKDLSGAFRPGPLALVLEEALKPENRRKPYFVCLDEMNLARVEHYFSDVLSVLETQEWRGSRIVTTRLLQPEMLSQEEDRARFGDLHIPDNVYLIGTVNMDETTHPFSKKVLDRANTIEFNYIALDQYPFLEEEDEGLSMYPVSNGFLRSEYLQLVDVYHEQRELVEKVTEKLVRINQILEPIHAHIGFRIRDAVCFYMIYNEQFGLMSEDEAFDHQLLQKLLPRIQGSSISIKRALLLLMKEALGTNFSIDEHMEDASPLYLRQDWSETRYPRSARKLGFMLGRLEEDGFTSYWLS